jgi:DHA2 family multidrug resistance protein
MAVMLGPAIGPTLGGYIVDNYHWSWIFFINLPVGALGMVMVTRFVHEPEDIREANKAAAAEQRKNLDWQGIALLAVGLAALQYLLEEGQQDDWFDSRLISFCAVVAAVSLAAFVWREFNAKSPAVNLRLFRDTVFTSGTLIGSVMFSMLMASMFLLPVFMQEMLGFTATQSGIALMPRVLVMMVATPFVGKIYNHVSPRLLVGIGVVLVSVGSLALGHVTLQTSSDGIVRDIAIQGVGFAFLFVPLTTAALSNVPRTRLADATGLNSLLRQIGGSIGVAIFATLLSRYAVRARHAIVAHLTPGRPEVLERLRQMQAFFASKGYDPASAKAAAVQALGGTVAGQSMVLSFEQVFHLSAIVFLLVLPLLLFLKVNRHDAHSRVEVEIG